MSLSSDEPRTVSCRRRAQAGYALLEFLVAFTILTASLTAFLAGIAVAFRSDQQAAFLTVASTLAKAKMAAAGVDFPLRPGDTTDVLPNGFVWRAVVREHAFVRVGKGPPVNALWVEVTVSDPISHGSRQFSLAALEFVSGERP